MASILASTLVSTRPAVRGYHPCQVGGALLLTSALLGAAHVVVGLRLLRAAEALALGLFAGWWVAAWLARVLRAPACASLLAAIAVPAGQAALS